MPITSFIYNNFCELIYIMNTYRWHTFISFYWFGLCSSLLLLEYNWRVVRYVRQLLWYFQHNNNLHCRKGIIIIYFLVRNLYYLRWFVSFTFGIKSYVAISMFCLCVFVCDSNVELERGREGERRIGNETQSHTHTHT